MDGGLTLHEQIEDRRQQLLGDAHAVVRDGELDLVVGGAGRDADVAAAGGVLRRVRQQVRDDLRQAHWIRIDDQARARHVHGERVALFSDQHCRRLHGAADDGRELHRRLLQLDFAARDARDVQQVVHEVQDSLELSFDDDDFLGLGFSILEQLERRHDRGERVPQLVPEHGQKLVLGAARSHARPHQIRGLDAALQQAGCRTDQHDVSGRRKCGMPGADQELACSAVPTERDVEGASSAQRPLGNHTGARPCVAERREDLRSAQGLVAIVQLEQLDFLLGAGRPDAHIRQVDGQDGAQ